jgi:hypothetical protein
LIHLTKLLSLLSSQNHTMENDNITNASQTPAQLSQPARPRKIKAWPVAEEVRLRSLYSVAGLSSREVGAVLGRSERSVQGKVLELGLTWGRGAIYADDSGVLLARSRANLSEIASEISGEARDLTLKGFKLAHDAADSGDAKGFNNASAGTARFNALAVAGVRGFSSVSERAGGGESPVNIGLFFFDGKMERVDAEREVVDVSPLTTPPE